MQRKYLGEIKKPKSKKGKIIGWGLGLGLPALFASALLVENEYGIVNKVKVIPTRLSSESDFEFYPGRWKKEYVDCNSDAGLDIFNISKELSGLPEGDNGYWEGQLTRKNPNGFNRDSGGCYLWVPEDYKRK